MNAKTWANMGQVKIADCRLAKIASVTAAAVAAACGAWSTIAYANAVRSMASLSYYGIFDNIKNPLCYDCQPDKCHKWTH